jgi:NADH-quinone oxidoreductase subunit H
MDPILVAKTLFIFLLVVGVFAPVMTWVERKQSALMQDRVGANRASILGITALGLIHPLADVIKMITKEDTVPEGAHRIVHLLCPFIAAVPALIGFAVIPYGGTYTIGGTTFTLVAADLDWGVLYIFAIASIATYGTVLAGWAGANNWGVLGSLRASAQMISYEVAMGISVIGVFMIYESLKLTDIGVAQQQTFRLFGFAEHFGWVAPGNALIGFLCLPMWGILLQPLSFVIFLAALMAENKRAPFDIPEGESEIIAGYFIEYSGMKFGLYYMAEWLEVVVISGVITAMFLGGWSLPWISDAALVGGLSGVFGSDLGNVLAMAVHVGTFLFKVIFMIWFQQLVRWSLPRFRYDQVMDLGWKVMLPLSLANIVVTALALLTVDSVVR